MNAFRELQASEMQATSGGLKLGVSGNVFLDLFLLPAKLFLNLFVGVRI